MTFLFGLQLLTLLIGMQHSLVALVGAHLVFVLPYLFLSLADPWRSLDPRYDQLAASLGARPWHRFVHMRLPLLLRPVLTAAAVGFAVSIGQYLPTILLGGGRWETITTEAVALSAGGDRRSDRCLRPDADAFAVPRVSRRHCFACGAIPQSA